MYEPSTVLAIVLKTSLLIVGVGLVAQLMARQSAAWRHVLWTAALALSLLMPLAVVSLPSYVSLSLPWEPAPVWVREEPVAVVVDVRRDEAAPEAPGQQPQRLVAAARETPAAWPGLMSVWLVGTLLVLLRNVLAHVGLFRWARSARPALSPAWAGTLRRVLHETGFRGRLRVLESDCPTSPCTWGILQPVLLLPAAGAGWPEPQRRLALLHELAHVRRFDYLTTQMAHLACAVHWFNPLVWFAAARARALQERACDDAVLNAGGMPSDYARFLVSIAGNAPHLSLAAPAAVGMVQRSQLHGRVTAILDASRLRLPLSGLALVAVLVPLAFLMLFLATLSATAAPGTTQPSVPQSAPFSAVELRHGGTVTVAHGETQRVTVLRSEVRQPVIAVRDDGRLVIEGSHGLEVEVVTPALTAIAVAEGGRIQTRGEFPAQRQMTATVRQGGAVDIRSLDVANVTASVDNGGRIFTKPRAALTATVEQGGNVTYWGEPVVTSSIRYGGVVVQGDAADAERTLAELMGPQFIHPVPPTPPVPAVPALLPNGR